MNIKLFKDTSLQWGISISIIFISLVTNFILAKHLNIQEFSNFSEAMALGSIILIIFDFGFKNLIFRENVNNNDKLDYLQLAIVFSFVILIIMIFLVSLIDLDNYFILSILCFYLINLIFFKSYKLKAEGKFFEDFRLNVSSRFIGLILLCIQIFYLNKYNATDYFLFWFISLCICFLFFNFKDLKFKPINFDKKIFKQIIYFFLIDFFIILYFKSDILLLSYFKVEDLYISNYNIAHKIFELPLSFIAPLCLIFYRENRLNYEKKKKLINISKHIKIILLLCAIYFFTIIFFYDYFIKFLFNNKFIESIEMVKLMSLTIFFLGLNCYLILLFFSINKEKIVMKIVFLIMIINILFNFIFINLLGYYAVIYSFIFTEIILSSILLFKFLFVKKELNENSI